MSGNTKHPATVLIIDDHPMVRVGLRQLINAAPDLSVCAEAADEQEALHCLKTYTPDLVVLDLSLTKSSGLKLIKRLHTWSPGLKVLVASMHDEFLFAERALRAGAMGYLHKREAADKVVEALRLIIKGKVYLSPRMTEQLLLQDIGDTPSALGESPISKLSDRELEVFEFIGRGLGTAQIAEQLHLSIKTIETHRAHIKKKLNLASSNDLIRRALQWTMEA